jgi:large subunit ribosomal protein L4
MELETLFPEIKLKEKTKQQIGLIHRAYLQQLNDSKRFLASTKTRSEVRGGGRKPWKQKGTGNARAGSIRSPLWVGGGISFGPKPRVISHKINKKEKQLAILFAIFLNQKKISTIQENTIDNFVNYKTKEFVNFLTTLNIKKDEKILIILSKPNYKFWLASRNLKNIEIGLANTLNIHQLLKQKKIIISDLSLKIINLTYLQKI